MSVCPCPCVCVCVWCSSVSAGICICKWKSENDFSCGPHLPPCLRQNLWLTATCTRLCQEASWYTGVSRGLGFEDLCLLITFQTVQFVTPLRAKGLRSHSFQQPGECCCFSPCVSRLLSIRDEGTLAGWSVASMALTTLCLSLPFPLCLNIV